MGEGEKVTLLRPKFRVRWLAKWLLPRMKKPYYYIHLDKIGSFVWLQCDGRTSVREIGERMRKRFGEAVEPVYERLALFMRQLEDGHFIVFEKKSR